MWRALTLLLALVLALSGCGRIVAIPLSPSRNSYSGAASASGDPEIQVELVAKNQLRVTLTNTMGTDMSIIRITQGSAVYADATYSKEYPLPVVKCPELLPGLPVKLGKLRQGESVTRDFKVDIAPTGNVKKAAYASIRLSWETGMESRKLQKTLSLEDD